MSSKSRIFILNHLRSTSVKWELSLVFTSWLSFLKINIKFKIYFFILLLCLSACIEHSPFASGLFDGLDLDIPPRTVCRVSCFADERVEAAESTCFVLGMFIKTINQYMQIVYSTMNFHLFWISDRLLKNKTQNSKDKSIKQTDANVSKQRLVIVYLFFYR